MVDVLEAVRLAAIRARAVESRGLERWSQMWDAPAHRYYPVIGQVYDIEFAWDGAPDVITIGETREYGEHGSYMRVNVLSGGGMWLPVSTMTRLMGDNSARLRIGE